MVPLLKWAGGKRKLVKSIIAHTGKEFNSYIEPFVGGGAMLLYLQPEHAICSDTNEELINFYRVVQNDVDGLIEEIESNYIPNHNQEFFYKIRRLDRDVCSFNRMTSTQRAARFVYLNKTCYNGLWRVNRQGFNNVPWGRHVALNIWNKTNLMNVHNYLSSNDVCFFHSDYKAVSRLAGEGDFVYFDPPYDAEEQNGFVDYCKKGFNRENQIELRDICNELVDIGAKVAVSNADTQFIRDIFTDERYRLFDDLQAQRSIGSCASYRQKVNELLIVGNYE